MCTPTFTHLFNLKGVFMRKELRKHIELLEQKMSKSPNNIKMAEVISCTAEKE